MQTLLYPNFINKRSRFNAEMYNLFTSSYFSQRSSYDRYSWTCRDSHVISEATCEQNLAHKFREMEMASRPISLAIFPSFSRCSIPARRIKRYSTFQNVSFAFYSHVREIRELYLRRSRIVLWGQSVLSCRHVWRFMSFVLCAPMPPFRLG